MTEVWGFDEKIMPLSNSLQFDKITFFSKKDLRPSHEYDNIVSSLFEKTEAQVK
ncbi:hypothetical protein ScFU29_09730 [Streptococcus canis]|nr:hypothetical protein ScFU29_09730 [Streptococcus canis]